MGYTVDQIQQITKVPPQTTRRFLDKAISRGYRPEQDLQILDSYVEDGARSGRPKEISKETEDAIIQAVTKDRNGREKSSEVLAYEAGISSSSTLKILGKYGFSSVKPTRKPGLNETQRKERLDFCLRHKDWTLEDWKNVVWSDETSVILGHRRGTQRLWRRADEGFEKSAIRNRWKGYSEFMFWGCFTYDKKGPCHIWKPETPSEKKRAQEEIDRINKEIEPIKKEEWELLTRMRRLGLRSRPGRVPQWNFTERTGKLVRRAEKGRIDWYRYNKVYNSRFFLIPPTNPRIIRKSFMAS
jgi:transposase